MYPRPSLLSKVYSPALVREICRKSRAHPMSSVSRRPYTFHIGASWAGKTKTGPMLHVPWPADGLVGAWRDKTLVRSHSPKARDAGEDFFFIQEVRQFIRLSDLSQLRYVPLSFHRCVTTQYVFRLNSYIVLFFLICASCRHRGRIPWRSGRRWWLGRQRRRPIVILSSTDVPCASVFAECLGRRT